jgi:D-alanyl-D-alanine dipeptidase
MILNQLKNLKKNIIGLLICLSMVNAWALPESFLYAEDVIPSIHQELRYFGNNNFVGRPIHGYRANRIILTKSAASALKAVQEELGIFGLGLLVFDAYRPQQAVDDFVAWSKDLSDTKTKSTYYPRVPKEILFAQGYIAERSGHSRGSTVDLTIVSKKAPFEPLDMGTGFDFFGPESWPNYAGISTQQRANRLLLQNIMIKHGFSPYPQEWWHFTLKDEPFPNTYFNFLVQ